MVEWRLWRNIKAEDSTPAASESRSESHFIASFYDTYFGLTIDKHESKNMCSTEFG